MNQLKNDIDGISPAALRWVREALTVVCAMSLMTGCATEWRKASLAPDRAGAEALTPETARFYFGDLHQHTNVSDGSVTPTQALQTIHERRPVDFVAITDHSQYFDSPEDWTRSEMWANIRRLADEFTRDGELVVLAGYEWSKNKPEGSGGRGHINVYSTDWYSSAMSPDTSLEWFYGRLAESPGAVGQFNHPSRDSYSGFGFLNEKVDDRITLFEIATRSNPKADGKPRLEAYVAALDKGWHLAPTDNTDSHQGAWWIDNCQGRSAVLCDRLSRESILDAMRNRRVYATYDSNLKVMFLVNGQMMGAILEKPATLDMEIVVVDPDEGDDIVRIDVLTEGGAVAATRDFSTNRASWSLQPDPTRRYYFLRIVQQDGQQAFSAPIWTGH